MRERVSLHTQVREPARTSAYPTQPPVRVRRGGPRGSGARPVIFQPFGVQVDLYFTVTERRK